MTLPFPRLLSVSAAAFVVAHAVIPVAGAETLEQAWESAVLADPTLEAAQHRVDAARADLDGARAERYPLVSASTGVTRFDGAPAFDFGQAGIPFELPLFDGASFWNAAARVSVPIYTGGMLARGIDAASAALDARDRQAHAAVQELKLAVAEAFVQVLHAESTLAVAESHVASLSAHAHDVQEMYAAGAVAKSDFLSAAVSLADAEQRRLQARNGVELARAAYNRELGRELTDPVQVDEPLPALDSVIESSSVDALTALALQSRDELAGLAAGVAALRARAEATRAQTRPQLALSGGYTFLENQVLDREDFWSIGVGVRWSLYDSGRTRASTQSLLNESAALGREREDLESTIALQVRQAWLDVQETRERTRVTEAAVAQAEENLRVVRDRYRNGEGTSTEVLDGEALRSLSLANRASARHDAALARFRLARAAGLL